MKECTKEFLKHTVKEYGKQLTELVISGNGFKRGVENLYGCKVNKYLVDEIDTLKKEDAINYIRTL